MRLPTDATLLIGQGAPPELEQVWREERLPLRALPCPASDMEALETATLVVCGEGGPEAAAQAARLGFRTFLVGDGPAPEAVRCVDLAQALEAGRAARARERWKATRSSAP
jgi:hypothetical protein